MTALLARYGLQSLTSWASDAIIRGLSSEEIELQLRDRVEFKSRFPSIAAREAAGLPPLSVDEYLTYETAASQLANAFGITITRDQVNAALAQDISVAELEDRASMAAIAVYQSRPEFREQLQRLYGVTTGDLVSYWLDPKTTAQDLQRRFAVSQIAAEAQTSGFRSNLTAAQGTQLFEAGLTGEQARAGFGELVSAEELFESVDQTETDIDIESQLSLLTGNEELAQTVERRGAKRAAKFQEGGGFSTGETGIRGLGSANQ
jgi:hypothetical protein